MSVEMLKVRVVALLADLVVVTNGTQRVSVLVPENALERVGADLTRQAELAVQQELLLAVYTQRHGGQEVHLDAEDATRGGRHAVASNALVSVGRLSVHAGH